MFLVPEVHIYFNIFGDLEVDEFVNAGYASWSITSL
jgi:hypothetical protein